MLEDPLPRRPEEGPSKREASSVPSLLEAPKVKRDPGTIVDLATRPLRLPRPYFVFTGVGAIILAMLRVLLAILLFPFDYLARLGWDVTERTKE